MSSRICIIHSLCQLVWGFEVMLNVNLVQKPSYNSLQKVEVKLASRSDITKIGMLCKCTISFKYNLANFFIRSIVLTRRNALTWSFDPLLLIWNRILLMFLVNSIWNLSSLLPIYTQESLKGATNHQAFDAEPSLSDMSSISPRNLPHHSSYPATKNVSTSLYTFFVAPVCIMYGVLWASCKICYLISSLF